MLLQRPFEVVTTSIDGSVLEVLAGADAWFSIARVRDLSGVRSRDQVRRVLARLAETGVLDEERVANSLRYRLNREHLAAPAVMEIASLRERLLTRLREALAGNGQLVYAALFGSAARGDMRAGSDIDLFLIRVDEPAAGELGDQAWDAWVMELETQVARWTGNPVNVFVMQESEVSAAGNTAALANINREGICLYGSASWLSRALGPARMKK